MMDTQPIPYLLRARLMDWYQGWRDGRAGIPDRQSSVGRVTTPHRETLIRMALEVFEQERLRYEQARDAAPERIAAMTARLDQLTAHRADAELHLAEVSAPLSREEETWRRVGDLDRAEPVVIQRRRTEHRRRIVAARLTLDSIKDEIARAEAAIAEATKADERELRAATTRVVRFHQHIHRRLNSYLRTLRRYHPDGHWAAEHLTVEPFLPGWITKEAIAEESQKWRPPPGVGSRDPEPPSPSDEQPVIIRLILPETHFGSEQPFPHVQIDAPGTATRHFTLIREDGNRLRLRDYGYGHGPYRNGVRVKWDLLKPGDHFEFGDHRYKVRDGCAELERTLLHPVGVGLIVTGLCARAGKKNLGKSKPRELLTHMAFTAGKNTLLAVVGRSGAGKSSLLEVLIGDLAPHSGEAYFGEMSVLGRPPQFSDWLGFVPQYVNLHGSLTVWQLLDYSFRLRDPANRFLRSRKISEVCESLKISHKLGQLVSTLSGGERRRVSIAIELLSDPQLLILDEPTSGLDPGMDREIMLVLRRYAMSDRTVIVTTLATAHLAYANKVLVVADHGRPILLEDSERVRSALEVESYADLMDKLTEPPRGESNPWADGMAAAYQHGLWARSARQEAARVAAKIAGGTARPKRKRRGAARKFWRQLTTLARRQATLLRVRGRSSPRLIVRVAVSLLPFLIAAAGAALAAWITPDGGLGSRPSQAGSTALGVLTTLAMLSGQALTYGDLVTDFPIIQREHRTGTGLPPVMLSKWLVFAVVGVIQAALITVIFTWIQNGPAYTNVLPPVFELWVDLAALTVSAMSLGLLISAVARKLEQAVALVTLTSIAQIALNGVTAPVPGVLNWIAMVLPDRWGLSAAASSVDLLRITQPRPSPPDALWAHTTSQWLTDLTVIVLLTVGYTSMSGAVLWLRLKPAAAPKQQVSAPSGGS